MILVVDLNDTCDSCLTRPIGDKTNSQNVFPGGKQWNKSSSGNETSSSYVKVVVVVKKNFTHLCVAYFVVSIFPCEGLYEVDSVNILLRYL